MSFTPSSSPSAAQLRTLYRSRRARIAELQACVNVYPNTIRVSRSHQKVSSLYKHVRVFCKQLSAPCARDIDFLRTIFVPLSTYPLYGRLVIAAIRALSVLKEQQARDWCGRNVLSVCTLHFSRCPC
jgi:hypothetical protein